MGRDADEYTIRYRQCGLCALGRQEGLAHLVPHMCLVDIQSVEWMGGTLYRTKTLAAGGDCCDFYICRKGSRWDEEKSARPKVISGEPDGGRKNGILKIAENNDIVKISKTAVPHIFRAGRSADNTREGD